MATTTRHVALLISMVGSVNRDIVQGIAAAVHGGLNWSMQYQEPQDRIVDRLKSTGTHGVIASLTARDAVDELASLRIPVVNVSQVLEQVPFPSLHHDPAVIADLACGYFVERGFEQLGVIGLQGEWFSIVRIEQFRLAAARAGVACATKLLPEIGGPSGVVDWREQETLIAEWLRSLTLPVGILAANDGRAVQLMEVARQIGLRVPEDLAVLGVDNNEFLCMLARPPLSSVQLNGNRLGLQAARTLEAIFSGGDDVPAAQYVPAVGIVTRQSSDIMAISDPDLAMALRYIRDRAARPIRADAVANQVALSRRTLERRFTQRLGRSMLDEIHRAHVERAKQLLAQTDLAMPEVAERSGFASSRHLPMVFRKLTGMTPTQYREQHRLR